MKNLLVVLALLASITGSGQGLKTQGKVIVNAQGEEVLLRGMGPGGWMVMEGYMNQSAGVAGTQHEIREKLIELMGEDKTDEFFEAWRANHFTQRDVDSLAAWGFNSIRLPMHYNLFTLPIEDEPIPGGQTWIDTGFEMVDDLLDWCEANEMYLILDLHAAPGGQGYNADISDYDTDKPSLWESQANRDKTVALWKKLAERYKDEVWIGGYDLINEPNWDLPGGTLLRELYEDITEAIRAVGDEHIIYIEGNWFANDYTGLTPPWDDNMVYSFHKYWSGNDEDALDWVLPLRETHNVPLWMGESGENSNTWFTEAISLFEANNIGWAWWTMRKIETITSPYSVTLNPGYQKILDYWKGEGPKPSEAEAFDAMMQLNENLLVDNSFYHPDLVDAMFRQVQTDETLPYTNHSIPGIIHFSDYDLGKNGFAYYDVDAANYQLTSGSFQAWNSGWTYRNDGVDIEKNTDAVNSNGYHLGFVHKGEWTNYTTEIAETASYDLKIRIASQETGGKFHFSLDGEAITTFQTANATGGWTDFVTHEITGVLLEAGAHVLTLNIDNDIPVNLGSVEFIQAGSADAIPFEALTGQTGDTENFLELMVNLPLDAATVEGSAALFAVEVNGEAFGISNVAVEENSERKIVLTLEKNLLYTDVITISYDGTAIRSQSAKTLGSFSALAVTNLRPKRFLLPGKIEAEDFAYQSGFQTEETTDEGGGQNLGYVNAEDYADYLVLAPEEMNMRVDLRVAALFDVGSLGFYVVEDDSETELFTIETPVTGGWQTWETISTEALVPQGNYTLRIKILANGEFNINWFEFRDTILGLESSLEDQVSIFPNPASESIRITSNSYDQYSILAMDGSIVERGILTQEMSIDLQALGRGTYILKLVNKSTGSSVQQRVIVLK